MRRTIIELLHLLFGIAGTVTIAWLCAWAVPLVSHYIWPVSWVVLAIVIYMGLRPLRLAWRADRDDAKRR